VHDFLTVGAAAPLQAAAVKALGMPDSYYEGLKILYEGKRKLFLDALDQSGLTYTVPQGAYYVLVDISEFKVESDVEFAEWMTKEVGVAPVPGSSFFHEDVHHFIRFHFAKRDETIREAGNRLRMLREKAAQRRHS
jgi:aminotransferase